MTPVTPVTSVTSVIAVVPPARVSPVTRSWRWLAALPPHVVLLAALALFLEYAFPGFVGFDQVDHFVQARTGVYNDAHPPTVALLFRACEVFVRGPALVLIGQALLIEWGLFRLLCRRLAPRAAAWAAAAIFLWPPFAGVFAVVGKDGLMFGFLLFGLSHAIDRDGSRGSRALGFACLFLGTAVRWNALAATAPLVVLLIETRWSGVRRYLASVGIWLAITAAAFLLNQALTARPAYYWYCTQAYQDIANTVRWSDLDEPTLERELAATPLAHRDHVLDRIRASYNPAHFVQLNNGPDRIWNVPQTDAERTAVARAWRSIVLGHVPAYLRYRRDNFALLLSIDRIPQFSNVYVWFHQLAEQGAVDTIQHDATSARIGAWLRTGAIAVSLTPLYWVFLYVGACLLLLPFALGDRLATALLLSALAYEAAWFFIAPTTDFRYSTWLMPCLGAALALTIARRVRCRGTPGSCKPGHPP